MIVFLNGQFVSESDAKISVFDHGFLYGDGVYETLRTYYGCIWQAEVHVKRLFQSARFIGLKLPWTQKKIVAWLRESIDRNCEVFSGESLHLQSKGCFLEVSQTHCDEQITQIHCDEQVAQVNCGESHNTVKNRLKNGVFSNFPEFRIRLTVSRGVNHFDFLETKHPTICIAPELILHEPSAVYEKGVSAITFPIQRFLPEAKSLNYLPSVLARQAMVREGAYEAFFVNPLGFVSEGTISNIFLVIDGTLVTPKDGMLPGITRDTVLKVSPFPVFERKILRSEFANADECFLTSTVKGIVPIVEVDGKKIGHGTVGKMTQSVISAFEEYIKKSHD
ncbi:aminotransferase class IV [Candidatus Peregrinibacteria bacterium]|nr:aminotransferase class IV [Candidatus Peregrinibacteria bacterium]